jgi:hypothetical protein
MTRRLCPALVALALLASAPQALAFCRATTCDSADLTQHCQVEAKTACVQSGEPLFWSSSCVTFSVQAAGAPQAGIDYAAAKASLQRALDAWTHADCGGKAPSLSFAVSDPVSCDASEYNRDGKNANIVIFREDEWPYEGGEDALGLTRVRFDLDNNVGELYDSDIEINAVTEPLSLGDPGPNEVDLDSLMTHEVGHALGLAHSLDLQATMIAGYAKGSTGLRSLGDDDIAGVCDVYPPARKAGSSSCEPRHGFSALCGAEQPAAEPPAPDPPVHEADPGSSSCALARGLADENARARGWGWGAALLGAYLRRVRKNGRNLKGF